MAWTWRYEASTGATPAAGTGSSAFPNQAEAETWLGESWRGLLEEGVDAVVLLDGEREVYGPMSLHPPAG